MALIIDFEKIFFHIPKTGGNSFRSFLQLNSTCKLVEKSHKHATPDFFYGNKLLQKLQIGDLFRERSTQSIFFVRNPITWYESWYKYQVSRGIVQWGGSRRISQWHPMSSLDGVDFSSFSSFICTIYETNPSYLTGLYFRYLTERNSVVCKMEDVVLDTEKELIRMGFQLSKFNSFNYPVVRPSPKLDTVWTKRMKRQVEENERIIFELFQYDN